LRGARARVKVSARAPAAMTPFVRPRAVRRGDRLLARSVLLILLAAYTATFTGLPDNPDAEVEFQTTSRLAREGRLALGGTPEAEAILAVEREGGQGFNVARGGAGREDEWFSWFGVGQALVALPFYAAGVGLALLFPEVEQAHARTRHYGAARSEYFEHLAVGWRNPLLGALTGWLVVLVSRRLGAHRKSAYFAGLTYGLVTFAWPQARSTLSDVQATFFLFLAFHLVLVCREDLERHTRPGRLAQAGIGLALGMAFLTRVVTAPAILVLGVAALLVPAQHRRRPDRAPGSLAGDLAWIAPPALACVALFLWLNARRFGDPLETGYGSDVFSGTFFSYPWTHGLAGILVAPGKGLLWLAPGVLLLPFGLLRARRIGERLWPWTLPFLAVAVLAPVAPTQTWHGAWTYGPRYALPLLPFLWVGVALALDRLARVRRRLVLAYALFGFGLVVTLPAVLVDHMSAQDLSVQAARVAWPDVEGESEFVRDNVRFDRMQWSFRFAAPWVHWRILRHRAAGLAEEYPLDEIFHLESDAQVAPTHERDRGSRHLAWVDLRYRLEGPLWPAVLLSGALLFAGILLGARGLDPAQP
jgi:4-amino-4-deoxy-L-arabinose transferase-like glycosyltransferase